MKKQYTKPQLTQLTAQEGKKKMSDAIRKSDRRDRARTPGRFKDAEDAAHITIRKTAGYDRPEQKLIDAVASVLIDELGAEKACDVAVKIKNRSAIFAGNKQPASVCEHLRAEIFRLGYSHCSGYDPIERLPNQTGEPKLDGPAGEDDGKAKA